ncbi:unnamed protein product [Didymodactylos carnosus]|uniref:Uncharacterized protein n=1 Tax=Didymodactylos carnosus TaxID=1234261 RepID=A0A815CTL3_9BILA|nr:unnamed protein product [Didymodactylos carnosus]CAF1292114.1 unnamed protein product [Didymodactylos carnosus]CAF3766242.1 unnamed protein product [Didymodactylos carnosus]CAF4099521.1 unnamed protein product [Didymodactylos carnosus]
MKWLEILVDLGAICGLTSVILVSLIAQPRILYRMSKDGLIPNWFSKERHISVTGPPSDILTPSADIAPPIVIRATPYTATIFTGTVCTLLSGFLPIELLSDLTSVGTLFAYLMVHLGVIILFFTNRSDKNSADRVSPYSNQKYFDFPSKTLFIPIIGALSCILLIYTSTQWTQIRFGIWTAVGLIIYFVYGMSNSKLGKGPTSSEAPPRDRHGDLRLGTATI